jgi:hypothetical protein
MSSAIVSADPGASIDNEPAAIGADLHEVVRSFGVAELAVIRSGHGVVLEGISPTYYGKQMAQELARKANLVVVANHITVQTTVESRGRLARAH